MKKVLAVALLDFRRFGVVLISIALVAGLLPSLASGLGARVPLANLAMGIFGIVGLALGGYFGHDFADGKGSFFFARPLPAWALIAGRLGAVLAISGAAFAAFMASFWLSSSDVSQWSLDILTRRHAEVLATAWAFSLATGLAAAAHGRGRSGRKRSARELMLILLRLALSIGAVILAFGLLADLMVRAYTTPAPVRLLFGSAVVACLVASSVGITGGRAEISRISRFMDLVIWGYVAIATVVIVASWTYILHPGPRAIRAVRGAQGSPDGRFAYVATTVDRGDPKEFAPRFLLDIASGQARHLNADANQGPWLSADGQTMVWSEATPFFFRPLWRYLGGARSFRVQTSPGEAKVLPMPRALPSDFRGGAFLHATVDNVLPAPGGDLFAIQWQRHLTFMSLSQGELADLDFKKDGRSIVASAFMSTGMLRAATVRPSGSGSLLEFVDIDAESGRLRSLMSTEIGDRVEVRFDAKAERAILSRQTSPGRLSISLVELRDGTQPARVTVLVPDSFGPQAVFLADGRIAAMGGGRDHGPLKIFSTSDGPVVDHPVDEGVANLVPGEMFAGVLAVRFFRSNGFEHILMDSSTGAVLRRLDPAYHPTQYRRGTAPPPGSPGARLLQSIDSKLYELPSLTAEPRLLLPVRSH